jgi:DNA-binding NarL/FixJ family response regulator
MTDKAEHNKKRILMIDDHPMVVEGLAQLINREPDLMVCGQAQDALKALQAIETLKPDMTIVDISLNGTNGIELIKDIKLRHGELPVLVLSAHDESIFAERSLRAGAGGYVMKLEAPDNLMNAIRRVLNGEIYLSAKMSGKMLQKYVGSSGKPMETSIDRLTDREVAVLQLIGLGHGTREIAEQLNLSVKTIETYRAHIMEKLDLKNATELVKYAIQWVQSQY